MSRRPLDTEWALALAHPLRLKILRRFLATGTESPKALTNDFGVSIGVVSYHVRFLATRGIIRLAGRTRRRGAYAHHYQLVDRDRVLSVLWGMRATLLVTDFERHDGRGDATVTLDPEALRELQPLTDSLLARLGELGLQTRERRSAHDTHQPPLTQVAVLLATDEQRDATA